MRFLREPLVHFLLIGALLFALSSLTSERREQAAETITVSAQDIALLREQWRQQAGRLPTPPELQALIDQQIREEVLYREAKALGLDRDDLIIRRRLVQKMDFLVADLAALAEPSDEELQTFFAAHAAQYQEPEKLSFTHIYFNPDQRRDRMQHDAQRVLAALQRDTPAPQRAPHRGDRFMLSDDYTRRTQAEIARDFGQAFAAQLFALPPGEWRGPIASGYGIHVVRIYERVEAVLPDFSTVRDKVKEDYLAKVRREANETAYQRLRARYYIVVAPLSESPLAISRQEAGQ